METPEEQTLPGPVAYGCLMCISERKLAEADGKKELPEVEIAVTLAPLIMPPMGIVAVPMCYRHIVVNKTSPLMAANGQLPPGLRRPGG